MQKCKVVKRNGVRVEFEQDKIENVVERVLVTDDLVIDIEIDKIMDSILTRIVDTGKTLISTEEINDFVERSLMDNGFYDEAKSFILYREKNKNIRKMSIDNGAMSEYIFTNRYSKYLPRKKRRETWNESVDRVRDMHINRYPVVEDEITWAFEQVRQKRVLPSMRSLQFGGQPIETNNARIYNCSYGIADRVDFFGETMFLLLCGCGVGFSVEFDNVNKIPVIQNPSTSDIRHVTISDSIEGWSDAIKSIVSSYIEGYTVEFIYKKIRKEGDKIKSGGKAPGHIPLRRSIEKIRNILHNSIDRKLKPIEVYDIVMHIADAVLSGGVRRSATICLFSPEDSDMMTAKTGEWFNENPQRGRSNNSVKLNRDVITEDQFMRIFDKQTEFGEPGFLFVSNDDMGVNPCQPDFATVLTETGIKQFKDIDIGTKIWSETGYTTITNKWKTGIKPVYKYTTTSGSFIGTSNHRVLSNGIKIEVGETDSIDILSGNVKKSVISHNKHDIMDGLIIGDGSVHLTSKVPVYLLIGENDQDYFNSNVSDLIKNIHPAKKEYGYIVDTTISEDELPHTFDRFIPNRFKYADHDKVCSFLRGIYSANGSICSTRITLKSSSIRIIEDVQLMLSGVGIRSYYTTNKPSSIKWTNGEYVSKQSYDLNITTDRRVFNDKIGFIQGYKNDKLSTICECEPNLKQKIGDVIGVEYLGDYDVYDITVDNTPHTYWTGGLNVSNCCEISLNPYLEKGYVLSDGTVLQEKTSGFAFCNLSTINGVMLDSYDDLHTAVKAATIIGTCQSGFTDFTYLSNISKEICDREALLGVSITGMMDSPDVALNPEYQQKAAKYAIEVNKEMSKKIGVNQSARVTCVKPEGCFTPETQIKTTGGDLTMSEIFQLNGHYIDDVVGMDKEFIDITTDIMILNEDNEPEKITKLFVNGVDKRIELQFEDDTIQCTPWHKFKLVDGSWKRADELTIDDDVLTF